MCVFALCFIFPDPTPADSQLKFRELILACNHYVGYKVIAIERKEKDSDVGHTFTVL